MEKTENNGINEITAAEETALETGEMNEAEAPEETPASEEEQADDASELTEVADAAGLMKQADEAYAGGAFKRAHKLYKKVLDIDPKNFMAVMFMALSSAQTSTVEDNKVGRISNAVLKTFPIAHRKMRDSREMFVFYTRTLLETAFILNKVSDMYTAHSKHAGNMIASSKKAERLLVEGTLSITDCGYEVLKLTIETVTDYAESTEDFWEVMTNLTDNIRVYRNNAIMNIYDLPKDEIAVLRDNSDIRQIMGWIIDARESRDKKRAKRYWASHPEEREKLAKDIAEVQEKIHAMEVTIGAEKLDEYYEKSMEIRGKKAELGMMQLRERRKLDKEDSAIWDKIIAVKKKEGKKEYKRAMEPLTKRLEELEYIRQHPDASKDLALPEEKKKADIEMERRKALEPKKSNKWADRWKMY